MFKNIKELEEFLSLFLIKKEKIEEFTLNKKLLSNPFGEFLSEIDFKKNEVAKGIPLTVKLKKETVARPLLNFILKQNQNIIEIAHEKQALEITYNKTQLLSSIKVNLKSNYYYLICYQKKPLGIGKLDSSKKKLEILFSIGDYLREK